MLDRIRSFLDWRHRRRVNARIKALRGSEADESDTPGFKVGERFGPASGQVAKVAPNGAWGQRIPAAIEKAWVLLGGIRGNVDYLHVYDPSDVIITRDEVGTAAALHQLWEVFCVKQSGRIHPTRPHPVVAKFTEKVEALLW